MAAVISLRPETDRGIEILDELEKRTEMKPTAVLADGGRDSNTRQYYLTAKDDDVDAFNAMLDKIDPNWRDHIENWRGERRNYPPGD